MWQCSLIKWAVIPHTTDVPFYGHFYMKSVPDPLDFENSTFLKSNHFMTILNEMA